MPGSTTSQRRRRRREKVKPLLPNLFTTAALFFGLLSIMVSIQTVALMGIEGAASDVVNKKFWWAAVFICISGLFDLLDGTVARLMKSESKFGLSYDSLSDLVSFGVAPGVLVFSWTLMGAGKIGLMSVLFYIVCTALRLARFNVQSTTIEKFGFTGIPSPAAAALMLAPVMLMTEYSYGPNEWSIWYYLFLSPFLGLLMVSDVRYSKGSRVLFRKSFNNLVIAAILIAATVANPEMIFVILSYIYGVSGLIIYVLKQLRRKPAAEAQEAFDTKE
ncbi:MAG: CDP-diacylglycerol--serine O-phosphatidyltransferase [Candidatus Dadabacteria bacterium]|nr:CDP-diacylglycerol--serine O-phosphatidyltransferase [Candidatus Dadabacteria bacterium]